MVMALGRGYAMVRHRLALVKHASDGNGRGYVSFAHSLLYTGPWNFKL